MTYKNFEELPVWQMATDLAIKLYDFTEAHLDQFRIKASLKSQLESATLSISNNIAEGFERGTTSQLLHFLYIAKGSAGEVRSMLILISMVKGFKDFKSEILNLKSMAEQCGRQLHGWAESLQNSDIKGIRHLNDQERNRLSEQEAAFARKREQDEFWQEIDRLAKESRGF
jgi:four helix bundle protein